MTITEFAAQHRLKVTKDDCGDPVIAGRIDESNIYEYGDNELGVMFITGNKPPRTGLFNKFRAACLAVGMTLRQVGDAEGAFSFDPTDPKQAKVAIRGIRARVKRQMTSESLARLATIGFRAPKPTVEALISA